MKTIKDTGIEPRTVALLTGAAIGLGIVVHKVFFLVALGVGVYAASEWVVHQAHEHLEHGHLTHRHV